MHEAPCSCNVFVDVNGLRVQVTGRGDGPREAARHLAATIAEVQHELAPAPPTIGELLEKACRAAVARDEDGVAVKALQAAMLVLRGAVSPPTAVQHAWLVQGSADLPYVVDMADADAPGGRSCNCPDWEHRNGPDLPVHSCKHILACCLMAKTQGLAL